MALYSLGGTTTVFTSAAAGAELRTSATDRAWLTRFAWVLNATPGSAFTIGLGRPAAIGVTPTTPVTVIADDQANPAGTAQLVTAGWGTAPTVPANFFRRHRMFHANRMAWLFPNGLGISVSSSLVYWNIATAVAVELDLTVDE